MVLETIKTQVQQMSSLTRKIQEQANQQWQRASEELQSILKEMGADNASEQSVKEIIAGIREKNPSFRDLMLNLDAATYDARKKASWNAHMTTAYVRNKVEESYVNDLQPMVANYRQKALESIQSLNAQADRFRRRFKEKAEEA